MTENKDDAIKHLNSLIHLDIDAVHAYDQAIDNIDVPEIRNRLVSFRGDHEKHVTDLSPFVNRLGGTPPEDKPDIKGFFITGFTAIRSMTGTHGALKAMRGNEEMTTSAYQKALSYDLDEEIKAVIRRNFDDEQRHLRFIEQALQEKAWEREQKRAV